MVRKGSVLIAGLIFGWLIAVPCPAKQAVRAKRAVRVAPAEPDDLVTSISLLAAKETPPTTEPLPVFAEMTTRSVEITVGAKRFTSYKFEPSQKYPYFHPVCGPISHRSLTTESSDPWPHHHSLFFGCDRVNGFNFWQDANDRGQIVSRRPKVVENGPKRVVIEDVCDWRAPGEPPVIEDHRRMIIQPTSAPVWLMDFHFRLVPLVDVKIEKTNHSLFAVRMEPHLGSARKGTMINAEGLKGEKATFGKRSAWMDCFGDNGWGTEGVAIFDHPSNPWYPTQWFTRDYGFISPTPMNWLDGDGLTMKKGEPLELHYRVVVHAGDDWQAGLAKLFERWKEEKF